MIREATPVDVGRLVEMGEQFRGSSGYRHVIASNPVRMRELANYLVQQPHAALFVSEQEGRLTGMIGLVIYPHPISAERIASEMVWWVDPSARGGGLRLLSAAEQWAKRQGATVLQMIAPTSEVESLYERLGFTAVERLYQRPIVHAWRDKEIA